MNIRKIFRSLKDRFKRRKPYKTSRVKKLPLKLHDKTIYVEEHLGYPWQLVMMCPCGCKQILNMNLVDEYTPYWAFTIVDERITVSPSIHRLVGCRSHFFIRKGNIAWSK